MNTRTLGLGLALTGSVVLFVWYFSSPNPISPSDIGLQIPAQATTSSPAPKSAPIAKPAPKPSTAPITSNTQFCPRFRTGFKIGDRDAAQSSSARGDIANLQTFLAHKYGLAEAGFVDGIFGSNTEEYLKRYQRDEGLSQTGVPDSATQERMLSYCIKGLTANGAEYSVVNFTFAVGSVTQTLFVHQALQEAQGSLLNGAFRIELISTAGTMAKLRATGPVQGGLQSETISLPQGGKVLTKNWPAALLIELKSVTSSGATLYVSRQ